MGTQAELDSLKSRLQSALTNYENISDRYDTLVTASANMGIVKENFKDYKKTVKTIVNDYNGFWSTDKWRGAYFDTIEESKGVADDYYKDVVKKIYNYIDDARADYYLQKLDAQSLVNDLDWQIQNFELDEDKDEEVPL